MRAIAVQELSSPQRVVAGVFIQHWEVDCMTIPSFLIKARRAAIVAV